MHKIMRGLWAVLVVGHVSGGPALSADLRMVAEEFFRGVFGCEPERLERAASEDVVVSYPIFETLFETPTIRGRDAVREFSSGFCRRWGDPQITVYEALRDGDRVVLVWGFSAVPQAPGSTDAVEAPRRSWGGISLFRFDEAGKVLEEVGEESTPGPMARLSR